MKKKTIIIISVVVLLIIASTITTILCINSYNNSLVGKINKFEILDKNIIKVSEDTKSDTKETINAFRDEFMEIYENQEYEECAKILNKASNTGLAIILTTDIKDIEENKIQLYTAKCWWIFDIIEDIGWDKIKWNEETQEYFYKTQFVFAMDDEYGKSECKRKVFEDDLEKYTTMPTYMKDLIKLSDSELDSAKGYRQNLLREKALDEAITELKKDLYSPNSLEVHTGTYSTIINVDEGVIKAKFDYSAMNLFGGKPRKTFEYIYEIDSIYLNWEFAVY